MRGEVLTLVKLLLRSLVYLVISVALLPLHLLGRLAFGPYAELAPPAVLIGSAEATACPRVTHACCATRS